MVASTRSSFSAIFIVSKSLVRRISTSGITRKIRPSSLLVHKPVQSKLVSLPLHGTGV
jgi:hypothetical protein